MKIRILFLLSVTLAATHARAQWTVYDPAVHHQLALGTAQEIAKFAEMIHNQVTQIKTLTDELNTMRHYVDLFGTPGSVTPSGVAVVVADLNHKELGKTITTLAHAADDAKALRYSAQGIFHAVGEVFTSPGGKQVRRRQERYHPIAVTQELTDNFIAVSTDVATRRGIIKTEIAKTTDQLKAATTDAEVQKLSGVLMGLSAALISSDAELHQATASTVVQDIAQRNDERRQAEARREQQHTEFTEAVQTYGRTFRLFAAPTRIP